MFTTDAVLSSSVGETPLVQLEKVVPRGHGTVWLKMESSNPTGSYKDRMAVAVLGRALQRGDIKPGSKVVEYTGGSTGTSLAFVAARLGLRFVAVSSDAFSEEKLRSMRAYGAEVIVEKSDKGTITPELIARMKDRAHELASEKDCFYTDQFGSPDVLAGYEPMGAEIADQTDGAIDAICAGVGTGGALMGAAIGLENKGVQLDVVALERAQAPLLTTGVGGAHRVEVIGVGFEPPFLDRTRCSDIRTVDENEAMQMCRRLAAEEGLLCGTSTGLNVCAAISLAEELGPNSAVVTLNCDSGLKYLSGGLFD